MYLRARHYDPTTAQFLQTDPLPGGSCNTHDYVCANPLSGVDPSGTQTEVIGPILVVCPECAPAIALTAGVVGAGLLLHGIYKNLSASAPDLPSDFCDMAMDPDCIEAIITPDLSRSSSVCAGITTQFGSGIVFQSKANKDKDKEHTKNARPSTEETHQKGDARRDTDKGGEKGDARRRGNPNKRKE